MDGFAISDNSGAVGTGNVVAFSRTGLVVTVCISGVVLLPLMVAIAVQIGNARADGTRANWIAPMAPEMTGTPMSVMITAASSPPHDQGGSAHPFPRCEASIGHRGVVEGSAIQAHVG